MESSLTAVKKEFEFIREDIDYLRQIISDTAGIVSSSDKYTMYYSRLAERRRAYSGAGRNLQRRLGNAG